MELIMVLLLNNHNQFNQLRHRMNPIITVSSVSKHYPDSNQAQQALDNISFTLSSGQVLGLLGHNGAGKSTLINALLGAHRFSGNITINGLDPIENHAELMKHLAYISDVNVLPEWMTIKQILKYTSGVHPYFDINKALSLITKTNIKLGSKIGSLSKGMKVQIHLALVIATNVKVLILDEPTLGLDLLYRDNFYNDLMAWFNQGERCLIIASHEVNEIEKLLTDVLILKQGKCVKLDNMNNIPEGTLADLFITLQKEAV
ncbi:ATP-binding cassette domain-containing protein [Aliivibrio fischeri]|nr:ATP-binding cassette domain-containing protein [Aliivibrio fischeri]